MPVVQITYDVPLDIAKGLATGELKMLGTAAVRNSTGIAAHIREVSRTVGEVDKANSASLLKSFKDPKVIAAGLGVVAVVAVVGGAAGWAASRKKDADAVPAAPECVEVFNTSLAAYLTAVNSGKVDAAVIDSLIAALDAIKGETERGSIAVEISVEQWDALVNVVADYTHKLAAANSLELEVLDDSAPAQGRVIDLRRYLAAQRKVFDEVA